MRYKCLVLDHDDTVVSSTACIHYPAFQAILDELRPGNQYSMEEFLTLNYNPGLSRFYRERMGFDEAEMVYELASWQRFVEGTVPPFFVGMPELIRRQKAEGGLVCVVSHSFPEYILRDYAAAGVPAPDLIYGWDADRTRCKPAPYPMREIMRLTGLSPKDCLMVDDLPLGMEMAHACGVDFAACGWGYDVPAVRKGIERDAEYYLCSVGELEALQFGNDHK